ncbi:Ankyrin repeat protein [Mycena chlorophos]|uniref:Ankyrin repeat protein n=1 Tax=Mycena chlorophos TaxID=658473 RepID=A0A8H6W2L1_MYCCL|nr:Ankyrin repeat protein [Mycena chlorophos]
MAADMHATNIYGEQLFFSFDLLDLIMWDELEGGTGGAGGAGGQQGGGGGTGQGNIVQIHTNSVQVHDVQSIDYDKLMDFLSPINYLPRQQEIFKTRHKDTGNWLLEHSTFLEWKSGSPQVLWCSGIPGSGKTVLS